MSHWQGTWRRKEYEAIESKPKRIIQYFDPDSDNIGKTDEDLLRIYFFRKPETRQNYEEPKNNQSAKKQLQYVIEQSRDIREQQEEAQEEQQTKNQSSEVKHRKNIKFGVSSASESSILSSFSNNNRFE